jgi:hypothetical protein
MLKVANFISTSGFGRVLLPDLAEIGLSDHIQVICVL